MFACKVHGECSLQTTAWLKNARGKIPACSICEHRQPQRLVVLNCDAHGFGDACTMAWASEGSRSAPVRLVHFATGQKREFLEMLGQDVVGDSRGAVNTFAPYGVEIRTEQGSVPRVISRARELGILSPPKRPPFRSTPAADKFAEELDRHMRASCRKWVMLFPQTEYTSREWPVTWWHDLISALLGNGIGVKTFLKNKDPRFVHTPGWYFGQPWRNVGASMLKADLVVGVSSGPACLAGTLDVPTLVLEGPTRPTIWTHTPSVEVIRVSKEVQPCVGCHFNAPFRSACDWGCQALIRLEPATVLKRILEKLNEPRDRRFSAGV